MKRFEDAKAMEQHESYHDKVKLLVSKGDIQVSFDHPCSYLGYRYF